MSLSPLNKEMCTNIIHVLIQTNLTVCIFQFAAPLYCTSSWLRQNFSSMCNSVQFTGWLHTQAKMCILFSFNVVNQNQSITIKVNENRGNAGPVCASGFEPTSMFVSFVSSQTFQKHLTAASSLCLLPLAPYLSSVRLCVCRPAGPSHNKYSPEHLKGKE